MNILVSGIAGDIGFGVGRILKDWETSAVVHGVDIHDQHAGPCLFDKCSIAPKASNSEYIEWINNYIDTNNIALFIPTSEAEISRITKDGLTQIGNAQILIANYISVMKSLDKFECLRFLSCHGIKVPANGIVGVHVPECYPIITKPRSGQGSKGILRVNDNSEYCSLKAENLVWQEYLTPDDEEYTCPVYRSPSAGTRSLVLRRKLQGGFTGSGEVVIHEEVTRYIEAIANVLDLNGVMNVQLRLTVSGPLLFEINPRLSSTLVFRDKLGFCDLRWWLADKLGLEMPSYNAPRVGTRFYRGAQEYILPAGVYKE